jgi:hypothetical protein
MDINELSGRVSSDFSSIDVQARNLLKIFICGRHKDLVDKQCIEELCIELKDLNGEFKVSGTFIMEHIKTVEKMEHHQKFELIWKQIQMGDNFPLCIMYGGKSATISQGFNAELQTVCKDQSKKQHTVLIRHNEAQLVPYANEFISFSVNSNDEFKKVAKNIVRSKLAEIKSFLTYKSLQLQSGN